MAFDDLVALADRAVQSTLGGETVTYRPSADVVITVVPFEVVGVFDANYVLAKGTAEAGVEATGPAVFFRLEDLPEYLEDDEPTLTIRDVDYRVLERRPDTMGGIVLVLRSIE